MSGVENQDTAKGQSGLNGSDKPKTEKKQEKKRKYTRDWIKAYTTNTNAFMTIKGRIRALAVEIIRDNPLITFNELIEKMRTRDEVIRKYIEGEDSNHGGRVSINRLNNVRKAIDDLAKEKIVLKIQLNDEPFVRFALPSQLEFLRQQGLQIVSDQ